MPVSLNATEGRRMNRVASAPAQGANRYSEPNITTVGDPIAQFANAIQADTGAMITPIPDGNVHRFDDPQGKRHNGACWYVLHLDGWPAGAYGNWRTDYKSTWRQDSERPLNAAERARIDAAYKAAKAMRERDRANAQRQAAERAQATWRDAKPAAVSNPYLSGKNIPALCLREIGDALLVPLRTVDGELVNLQRIYPDGTKRFLKAGQITGCFALFGRELPETGVLYICEGWATAATIAMTLQLPVAAAMNAGNLKAVAQAIRAARPHLALTIAADDDHHTAGNPGMTKAAEAARLVQGALTWPTTCRESDCTCTDFNDTANCGRVSP